MPANLQPIEGLEKIGTDLPAGNYKEDKASKKEEKTLFGDALRNETLKAVIHVVFIWFIRIAALALMVVFLVRVAHFILPEAPYAWCPHVWLSESQLQGIDKLFFSGAMGAALSRYLKGVFSEKDNAV